MLQRGGAGLLGLLLGGCAWAPSVPTDSAAGRSEARSAWLERSLPGKRNTRYNSLVVDDRPVVHAASNAAASLLQRKVLLEPAELGTVCFSWQVKELINSADLTDRDSADSPVRLILGFDGDHSRLSRRNRMLFDLAHAVSGEAPPFATLMYVWDNRAPLETVIHSGRTDRIRKIVLESGARNLGQWLHYERDIAADYMRAFGEAPGRLISVGLMTDSDNTLSVAEAWYGEVRLTAPATRSRAGAAR